MPQSATKLQLALGGNTRITRDILVYTGITIYTGLIEYAGVNKDITKVKNRFHFGES